MGNSNLTTALIIVLCLELVMFLGQVAITEINPGGIVFKNNTVFYEFATSDGGTINDSLEGDMLPSANSGVDVDTSDYTDSISSVRSWGYGSTGKRIIYTLMFGPAVYLGYMRAPNSIIIGIGTLWLMLMIGLLVGFFTGRNT